MVFSKEWAKEYGYTSNESAPTMPILLEIPLNKYKTNLLDLLPLSQQCALLLQSTSHALTSSITEAPFSVLLSISGRPLAAFKADEALPTSRNESLPSSMANYVTAAFLGWFTSSGAMTGPMAVASTPRSAPTPTLAPVLPVTVKADRFVAFFASFFTILHQARMLTRLGLRSGQNIFLPHESLMSVLLDASGCSIPPCLITTSMKRSSLRALQAMPPLQLSDHLQPSKISERLKDTSGQASHASALPVPTQEEAMESNDSQETAAVTSEPCKVEGGEDEWEVVNETLVYADCVGAVESELMEPGKSVLLVDLDTESPLIQIGPAIFQGTYAECLGTNLIFEKHHPAPGTAQTSMSAASRPSIEIFASRTKTSIRPYFTYFGKTSKNLNLQRVFLKPKE